jgi:hypothetical protein
VERVREYGLDLAGFDEPPGVKDAQMGGDLSKHAKVVRNIDHRDLALVPEPSQQVQRGLLGG